MGREELRRFPELKSKADPDDFLVEVLDFQLDTVLGKVLVKGNKSRIRLTDVAYDRNWVSVVLDGERVVLYSLASGEEVGHFFGHEAVINTDAGVVAVSNSTGQLQLYDLATRDLRREYRFHTGVAFKSFSSDGHRLFAFTRDQTAYVLDLTAP